MDELTSRVGRRIASNVPPGIHIQMALEDVCKRHDVTAGGVCFSGVLRDVRLDIDGTAGFSLSGPLRVVSGRGTIATGGDVEDLEGVLSWYDRGLPGVAAGRIADATTVDIRVVVETWDDVRPKQPKGSEIPVDATRAAPKTPPKAAMTQISHARPIARSPEVRVPTTRSPAKGSVEPVVSAPRPVASVVPVTKPELAKSAGGGIGGWAAAVAASPEIAPPARPSAQASPLELDPEELDCGDILIHPKFGRCQVMRVDDDRAKVRLPSGRVADLHLSIMKLVRQPNEDKHRVLMIIMRKRR